MKRLLILGATGSIGTQALDVVARAGDEFELVGLSAERSHEALVALAEQHGVDRIALGDGDSAARAAEAWTEGEVLAGPEGLVRLVAESDADLVLNAIVGSAGLGPTIATLGEGIDLALANKESLVVGGELGAVGEPFARGVRESIDRSAQPAVAEAVEIRTAQLGLRSELLGAVATAAQAALGSS